MNVSLLPDSDSEGIVADVSRACARGISSGFSLNMAPRRRGPSPYLDVGTSRNTMKAVVYDSPNVVKVVEKEIPTAGEGEAIVKVSRMVRSRGIVADLIRFRSPRAVYGMLL
jgi:hypothetical protein